MVTTVSPNANETPTRPMPTCGKAAASTALPQPPRTSQKVPMNSAASFLVNGMIDSCLLVFFRVPSRHAHSAGKIPETNDSLNLNSAFRHSPAIPCSFDGSGQHGFAARRVLRLRRNDAFDLGLPLLFSAAGPETDHPGQAIPTARHIA